MKKSLFAVLIFILCVFSVNSVGTSISCEWRDAPTCQENESGVFHVQFIPSMSGVLNTNLRTLSAGFDSNYDKTLCCSSPLTNLSITHSTSAGTCEGEEFMYYTGESNARGAFDFNPSHHFFKSCIRTGDQYTDIDIIQVDKSRVNDYLSADYSCLYRMSNIVNGNVAGCPMTFNGGDFYDYTVVARVFDITDTTPCNSDCTSELDGRIYSGCRAKLSICKLTPQVCDGSIVGAWVRYNETHEIQCSLPWKTFRESSFTNTNIYVNSVSDECNNIIKRDFTQVVNGEQVTMSIYVCLE